MPLNLTKAPAEFKTNKPMYKPYKSNAVGKDGMVYVKSNSGGKRLENPSTKKPIMSVTKADGKYVIIYGFNNIPAGVDLEVFAPGNSSVRVKIAPIKGIQNIQLSSKSVAVDTKPKEKKKTEESWIKKNKWIVIGGGVAVVGLIVTMIVLSKKKNK